MAHKYCFIFSKLSNLALVRINTLVPYKTLLKNCAAYSTFLSYVMFSLLFNKYKKSSFLETRQASNRDPLDMQLIVYRHLRNHKPWTGCPVWKILGKSWRFQTWALFWFNVTEGEVVNIQSSVLYCHLLLPLNS